MDGPHVDRLSAPSPFIGITLPITPNLLKWSPLESRGAYAPHGRGVSRSGCAVSRRPATQWRTRAAGLTGEAALEASPAAGWTPTVAAKDCLTGREAGMVVCSPR